MIQGYCVVYLLQIEYRVFDMDWGHFKELLWLRFWCQAFFPIIFMVEKCVHFDIWNEFFFTFSKGPPTIWLKI